MVVVYLDIDCCVTAEYGFLDYLKFCVDNGCEIDVRVCQLVETSFDNIKYDENENEFYFDICWCTTISLDINYFDK